MKFNWGTGIVITMLLFMGFILSFVWKATFNPKYDHTLVSEEYYQEDIHYQKEKDKIALANAMKEQVKITVTATGLQIVFPETIDANKLKGNLQLLRYANKTLDVSKPLDLKQNQMHLDKTQDKLAQGKYYLSLDWTYNAKSYLIKKEIFIK